MEDRDADVGGKMKDGLKLGVGVGVGVVKLEALRLS
jgi:hypothetical protein